MPKLKDLTGARFGRLTVLSRAENAGDQVRWNCLCDCGKRVVVNRGSLLSGRTVSCGCYAKEVAANTLRSLEKAGRLTHNATHRESHSRLYSIWSGMKCRCYCKSVPEYRRYGQRGIRVCEEWKKDFVAFRTWAESSGYQDKLTIDRIDNDGDYCPENCRWVTMKTQSRNRSSNKSFNGKLYAEWEEEQGFKRGTISRRISKGWSVERAIFTPVRRDGETPAFTTPSSEPSDK